MTILAFQPSANGIVVMKFASKEAAASYGNGWLTVNDAQELANSTEVTTANLVTIYNSFAGDAPVKRFTDRAAAAKRVWTIANANLQETIVNTNTDETTPAAATGALPADAASAAAATLAAKETKAKQKAEEKAQKEADKAAAKKAKDEAKAAAKAKKEADKAAAKKGDGVGRTSKFANKMLFPGAKMPKDENGKFKNPRRAGTFGHDNLQWIIDNPGITYEQFIAKGGLPINLRHDVIEDWVEPREAVETDAQTE